MTEIPESMTISKELREAFEGMESFICDCKQKDCPRVGAILQFIAAREERAVREGRRMFEGEVTRIQKQLELHLENRKDWSPHLFTNLALGLLESLKLQKYSPDSLPTSLTPEYK